MNKALLLGAKIRMKTKTLKDLQDELLVREAEMADELAKVDEAETEEEVNTLENNLNSLQEGLDKLNSDLSDVQSELDMLNEELEKLNEKLPEDETTNERGKKMPKNLEMRAAINRYVKTKGQERAGITTVDAGALIPVELLQPVVKKTNVVDLSKLVRNVKVSSGSGKYPVIKRSGNKMVSVGELEKNPELGKPTITQVDFSIETYRGYIPVSQESIDDADYDLTGLIADEIADQELNTKNFEISAVLKTATPKSAAGFDGIKDIINKDINPIYNVELVVSQSMFAALDKVKDNEGRYMMQPDVTSPTGYKFSGRVIYTLPDDMIGEATGDMVGFIGDVKEFATLFDRLQATVKWTDHNIYGQLLAGFVRFDTKAVDTDAGVYVTYTDAV